MKMPRYTEDFRIEAVKQVSEHGYTRKDVATRLGVSPQSLSNWIAKYDDSNGKNYKNQQKIQDKDLEIAKLKVELKRTKEERDILKKAAAYFANHQE